MNTESMNDVQPELNYHEYGSPTPEQFIDLISRLFRLRHSLVIPEYVAQFKTRIIKDLHESKMVKTEDMHFIMRIFMFLAKSQKPPTMGEISSELNTPLSTATHIIDWLVHIDIVERISDPDDRRVVRVCMSKKGMEYYQLFRDTSKKRVEQLMGYFSVDEQIQFFEIANKLVDILNSGTII